jgi:hypothetical protein
MAAQVSRSAAYRLRESNEDFRGRWDAALQGSVDDLEVAAFRRALKSSDTLLIFMLKAHRGEIYDRRTDESRLAAPPVAPIIKLTLTETPETRRIMEQHGLSRS